MPECAICIHSRTCVVRREINELLNRHIGNILYGSARVVVDRAIAGHCNEYVKADAGEPRP